MGRYERRNQVEEGKHFYIHKKIYFYCLIIIDDSNSTLIRARLEY